MLFFLYLLGIPARNGHPWTLISSGTHTPAKHHTHFLKCAQMDSLRERAGAVRKPHHKCKFSGPPGPVGAVLRRTRPNAICIPNRTGLNPDMLFFLYLLGICARNGHPWTLISSGTHTPAKHHTHFLKCAQMDSLRERAGAVRKLPD